MKVLCVTVIFILISNNLFSFNVDDEVIALTNINLRETPSVNAEKIEMLTMNSKLRIISRGISPERILGYSDIWYQVETQSSTVGWVYGAFIDFENYSITNETELVTQDFYLYSRFWNRPFFFGDHFEYIPSNIDPQHLEEANFRSELSNGLHGDLLLLLDEYLKAGIKVFSTERVFYASKIENGQVIYLSTTSSDVETRRGISVGSSYESVLERYGIPYFPLTIPNPNLSPAESYDGGSSFLIVYGMRDKDVTNGIPKNTSIGFVFNNAKVDKIIIYYGWPYGI